MKLLMENWRHFLKEGLGTKNKIFVLVGPPSVGKSHWVKETFEEEPYVISRDDIAKGVAKTYSTPDGTPWTYDDLFVSPPKEASAGEVDENYGTVAPSPEWMTWQPFSYDKVMEANNKIQELFLQRVSEAVPSGKDIVVDMTNMNANSRKGALQAIEGSEKDYEKIAVVFNFEGAEEIIKKVAAKRAEAAKRKGESKTIPPEAFDRMFKAFQQVDPSEGFDEVVSVDSREELERIANESEEEVV